MTVRKGWEAQVVISKIGTDESPAIVGEVLSESASAGDVLFTAFFPVVDATGTTTDDETKVKLYADGTPIASTDYTLVGATGMITLGGAISSKRITIDYNHKLALSYAKGVTCTVESEVEPALVLSQREPKEVGVGGVEITGNIDSFFVDRELFQLADKEVDGKLVSFDLEIKNTSSATDCITITISGVKFGTWNYEMAAEDFIAHNVDFTATNLNVSKT